MNGQQIREQIDRNDAKIQKLLNRFVLTNEINELLQDNEDLRQICKHEFEDGFCKYCDMPIQFAEGKHD